MYKTTSASILPIHSICGRWRPLRNFALEFPPRVPGDSGETLANCVRRLRLEAAAQRPVSRLRETALILALDVGFASANVFSRADRSHFSMPPPTWRRGGSCDWTARRRDELSKIHQAIRKPNQVGVAALSDDAIARPAGPAIATKRTRMKIEINTRPAHPIAYLRPTGAYGDPAIGRTWERCGQWYAQRGLVPPQYDWSGIGQDNLEITPADKLCYDCRVARACRLQAGRRLRRAGFRRRKVRMCAVRRPQRRHPCGLDDPVRPVTAAKRLAGRQKARHRLVPRRLPDGPSHWRLQLPTAHANNGDGGPMNPGKGAA
ncbi:MAG: GyrI-like domain-containing protein [Burkholderiaceae bacterium]